MIKLSQSTVILFSLSFFILLSFLGLMRAKEIIIPHTFTQETSAFPEALIYVENIKQLEEQVGFSVSTMTVLPESFERVSLGFKEVEAQHYLTRQTYIRYPDGKLTLEQAPKYLEKNVMSSKSSSEQEFVINGHPYSLSVSNSGADYVYWEEGAYVYSISTNESFSIDQWKSILSRIE